MSVQDATLVLGGWVCMLFSPHSYGWVFTT